MEKKMGEQMSNIFPKIKKVYYYIRTLLDDD